MPNSFSVWIGGFEALLPSWNFVALPAESEYVSYWSLNAGRRPAVPRAARSLSSWTPGSFRSSLTR